MVDVDKAREDLEGILKTEEYRAYYKDSKGLIETWWEKAKEWMAAQLEKLFPDIESASGASGPILIAVIFVVIILLAFSAFFLIRNTRRNRILRKQKPLQSINELKWTYQRHLEEAEKYEQLQEFTVATRHLFLAFLLFFHEKGMLEARIWKTNWEYYEELRKVNQQNAEQFYHFAHFFDEVMYGERKVQQDEYQQFQDEAKRLLDVKGEEIIR